MVGWGRLLPRNIQKKYIALWLKKVEESREVCTRGSKSGGGEVIMGARKEELGDGEEEGGV